MAQRRRRRRRPVKRLQYGGAFVPKGGIQTQRGGNIFTTLGKGIEGLIRGGWNSTFGNIPGAKWTSPEKFQRRRKQRGGSTLSAILGIVKGVKGMRRNMKRIAKKHGGWKKPPGWP